MANGSVRGKRSVLALDSIGRWRAYTRFVCLSSISILLYFSVGGVWWWALPDRCPGVCISEHLVSVHLP